MEFDVDAQAEMLALKVKHYLITVMGRVIHEANSDEFYRALSYALREEIMINWTATVRTMAENKEKMVYYLSLEYLPGRILTNNIINISSQELVMKMMHKLNRPYKEVASREFDPGLGNGGLGRLASCFLDSLATMHYPAMGYGLRYQYGIFEQQVWNGEQIEAPDLWLMNENPWEFRRDLRRVGVKFGGVAHPTKNIHGEEIYGLEDFEEVWALPYDTPIVGYSKKQDFSVVTLRLWTTKESPRNFQLQRYNAGRLDQAAENTALTDVLYPSDWHDAGKRVRVKQEFLLVSASLQDIIRRYLSHHDNFRDFADKVRIQINDTHPTLVIAEIIHLFTKIYDLPWNRAKEIALEVVSYTNHTVLKEALEEWDLTLMEYLLPRQTKIIEKLNEELKAQVQSRYPGDEERVKRCQIIDNGRVKMAHLAIDGSHAINGVAALHTEILKQSVFKDFYEMWPERFVNVTNGVTQRRWLLSCNPALAKLLSSRIGDGWITNFEEIARFKEYANDPETLEMVGQIKRKNKQKLIDHIRHHVKIRDAKGEIVQAPPVIEIDSLFDVQIKRFHEYKRQLMNALHILMLYFEILETPEPKRVKRTFIFAGKAAASYYIAKKVIQLIYLIARKIHADPKVSQYLKVIFIENYNVSKAEVIIPAADLSEQISCAGTEASGTGNMKLSMNGALTIGTDDGANVEMRQSVGDEWWPFKFGLSAEEVAAKKESYDPWSISMSHPLIHKAVEALRDRTLTEDDHEHEEMVNLYNNILGGSVEEPSDRFLVLQDLAEYYETQKKVEDLYRNQDKWLECVIHNIAGMGPFSTDVSIQNYAAKIWGIKPVPLNPNILERVREEYREHDKCRIF